MIKSMTTSSIKNNVNYKGMLAGNLANVDPYFSRVQVLIQNGIATNLGSSGSISNSGAVFSTNTYSLSGSSGTVNWGGGNKYFTTPYVSALNDLSQGMCIEFYVYITAHGSNGYMLSKWSNPWQWQFATSYTVGNTMGIAFRGSDGTTDTISNGETTMSLNTWTHIAFVVDPGGTSSGTTWRIYKNGIQSANGSTGMALNLTNTTRIGYGYKEDSGTTWDGNAYFDRIRITMKNRYTSNFTPPSAPLPTSA